MTCGVLCAMHLFAACLLGQALCRDAMHREGGVRPCSEARVGETCYRPGQPLGIKREEEKR